MKVRELMTRDAATCAPDTDLGSVALAMWRESHGRTVVVGAGHMALGMITEREICIGVALHRCRPEDLTASDVLPHPLIAVVPDDDIDTVLAHMSASGLRHLPVVDPNGRYEGIVSIDDLVRHATVTGRRHADLRGKDVIEVLRRIGRRGTHGAPHAEPATR